MTKVTISKVDLIDGMIEAIAKVGGKFNDMVQKCSASIVLHSVEHGDVTKADRLLNAIGDYARRDSLVTWFTTIGCMTIVENKDAEGKKFRSFGLNKSRRDELKDMIQAKGEAEVMKYLINVSHWSTAKKASDPMVTLDLDKMLMIAYKKAKKASADGKPGHNLAKLNQFETFLKLNNLVN